MTESNNLYQCCGETKATHSSCGKKQKVLSDADVLKKNKEIRAGVQVGFRFLRSFLVLFDWGSGWGIDYCSLSHSIWWRIGPGRVSWFPDHVSFPLFIFIISCPHFFRRVCRGIIIFRSSCGFRRIWVEERIVIGIQQKRTSDPVYLSWRSCSTKWSVSSPPNNSTVSAF